MEISKYYCTVKPMRLVTTNRADENMNITKSVVALNRSIGAITSALE